MSEKFKKAEELMEKSKKNLDGAVITDNQVKVKKGIGYALLAIAEILLTIKNDLKNPDKRKNPEK